MRDDTLSWAQRLLGALALVVLMMTAVGCGPPPFVLIDQAFLGDDRTAKAMMQRSDDEQFNQFIRVCSLNEQGEEVNCKDTLILENVVPGSMY